MNIGIITFQWADNYGAVLQAYALQTHLLNQGHSVEIIDYRPHEDAPGLMRLIRTFIGRNPRNCICKWEALWRVRLFEHFRRNYLVRTDRIYRQASDLENLDGAYDLLIAGGDQIWNSNYFRHKQKMSAAYCLDFGGSACRRISYAASFGHATTDSIDPLWRDRFADLAKGFDALSVREASGVGIIRELTGRNDAVHVADPTFLLDAKHYDAIAGKRDDLRAFLFSFILHGVEADAAAITKSAADALGLNICSCNAQFTAIHRGYILPSPPRWLAMVRDAAFIITNSFHCLVFCLIFQKPFLVLLLDGSEGTMNNRIIELLDACNLRRRIVGANDHVEAKEVLAPIDWEQASVTIQRLRTEGMDFLKGLQ